MKIKALISDWKKLYKNLFSNILQKMTKTQTINVPVLQVNLTPLAFHIYAKDFYEAYKSYNPPQKFSRAKYFLICMSIELAAKTLYVDQSKKFEDLKKIGHNLLAAFNTTVLTKYNISLEKNEISELKKANKYYSNKGFEYYLFKHPDINDPDISGAQLAMTGYPDLPDLKILESILEKLLSADLETKLESK